MEVNKGETTLIWIKSVHIENFESHKDTLVELSPGFNIFTGSSNCGKSSFIRAIRWVCFNEPTGEKFIRKDDEYLEQQKSSSKKKKRTTTKVTIILSNEVVIERIKNRGASGTNCYTLLKPGMEEPLVFDHFGFEVPDEIKETLGFYSVKIGNKKLEVNYLSQFEPPRALTYQGGALSSMINKLNNMENFEDALGVINQKIHHSGEYAVKDNMLSKRIEKSEQQLEKISDNQNKINLLKEQAIPRMIEVRKLEHKFNAAKTLIDIYEKSKDKFLKIKEELAALPSSTQAEKRLIEIEGRCKYIHSAAELLERHARALESWKTKTIEIAQLPDLSNIDLKLFKADKYVEQMKSAATILDNTSKLISKLNERKRDVQAVLDQLEPLDKRFEECLHLMLKDGGTCPMCQQSLDAKSVNIAKNYSKS